MFNSILNYGVRIIIILLGIAFVFNIFDIKQGDITMLRAIGVIMILFGIYRLLTYRAAVSRYRNLKNNDDE
ncbi:MAG: hypothetical protein ACPL1A_09650 [Candidatus Kapaibacteriota bacterium]